MRTRFASPLRLVEDLRAQFDAQRVGIQALMLLQGILRRAVVRGLIPANPVSVVDKPRQPPTRRPEPLPPLIVERIRAELSQREATLVSMLAYAGLRPGEATSARRRDLGERALQVHASKTERPRTIKLLAPLVQDLAEWRLASGRPPASALIFPKLEVKPRTPAADAIREACTWSAFRTQARGIPSAIPSSTSVGSPRMFVVARTTNTPFRRSIASSRVSTTPRGK